jgi:hypothetical protein
MTVFRKIQFRLYIWKCTKFEVLVKLQETTRIQMEPVGKMIFANGVDKIIIANGNME